MNIVKISDNIAKICLTMVLTSIFIYSIAYWYRASSFHSQFGQDLKVLKHYNNKKKGFFIEIGAFDGLINSNSYILEKKHQWQGICIEPIPTFFKELTTNRPDCTNIPYAAYNENDLNVEMIEMLGLSSITTDADKWLDTITKKGVAKHKVTTKTLTTILEDNNAPKFIDYLSIDTEGSELKVLQGIDFTKYTFGYITIEHNRIEPRRQQIRQLLEQNGYSFIEEIAQVDDVFQYSP